MKKDSTLKIVRERFANISVPGADLVRAEQVHRGKAIGVFYFDFSEQVLRPDFDVLEFAQEKIASDFYLHEGSLQWNYFIYFVLAKREYDDFLGSRKALEIEADRVFARKFVREQRRLNNALRRPLGELVRSAPPSQDVASHWVAELRGAGLDFVVDETAKYDTSVRGYVYGASRAGKAVHSERTRPASDGSFVRALHLDQFRTYPVEKHFEFGRFNLIRGPNGAGKTSLLEGIELGICGANRRQRGKAPQNARVRVEFDGQNGVEAYPRRNSAVYRARDRSWYGAYYATGNQLCQNFGRFNFFNSDAAYELASAETGEEILSAIKALLLGEFATVVEERMRQFRDRFAREERELMRQLSNRKGQIEKDNQQIRELRKIKDTREVVLEELKSRGTGCGWSRFPERFEQNEIELLRGRVEEVGESLSHAVESLSWLEHLTIGSIEQEAKRLATGAEEFARLERSSAENLRTVERSRERLRSLEEEISRLNRLLEYHLHPEAMTLLGTKRDLEERRGVLVGREEAMELLSGVDLKRLEGLSGRFGEVLGKAERELARLRRGIEQTQSEVAVQQQRIGEIRSVVNEIRGLGRHYCEIESGSTDCPLCGAHYEDLASRIESMDIEVVVGSTIQELTAIAARQRRDLAEQQRTVEGMTRLRRAAEYVYHREELGTAAIDAVLTKMGALGSEVVEERVRLEDLTAKVRRLGAAGFSESELEELVGAAGSRDRSTRVKRENIETRIAESSEALDALRAESVALEKSREQIAAKLRSVIERMIGVADVNDVKVMVARRRSVVDDVLGNLRSVQKDVSIGKTSELSAVSGRVKTFEKAVGRTQDALRRIEERDAIEGRIMSDLDNAKRESAQTQSSLDRAAAAVKLLSSLLDDDYMLKHVQQFVGEHRERISAIFSRIHSPHEFSEVDIDVGLSMRRENGQMSAVSEISTGQRAALALSIFLSLNSSVSGRAPWLLFDESVVNVDDLNVLSFLDMLRDLVLLGDRQVFFATANSRIGDLVAKKFDFLNGEFREFRFQR